MHLCTEEVARVIHECSASGACNLFVAAVNRHCKLVSIFVKWSQAHQPWEQASLSVTGFDEMGWCRQLAPVSRCTVNGVPVQKVVGIWTQFFLEMFKVAAILSGDLRLHKDCDAECSPFLLSRKCKIDPMNAGAEAVHPPAAPEGNPEKKGKKDPPLAPGSSCMHEGIRNITVKCVTVWMIRS
jgi:hypothetical protein